MPRGKPAWPDPTLPDEERSRMIEARNALVVQWAGLPAYVLSRMPMLDLLDKDDLRQELYLTLMRAAELYDPAQGIAFNTYAITSLRNTCLRLRDSQRLIHIPIDKGRSKACKNQDLVRQAEQARQPMSRIFFCPADDSMPFDIADRERIPDVEPEKLARVREKLRPRLWQVLSMRYMESMTLEEIGNALGFGKERARQVVAEALCEARKILHLGSPVEQSVPEGPLTCGTTEASMIAGVSRKTVLGWIKGGKVRGGYTERGLVRVWRDSLAAFLERRAAG